MNISLDGGGLCAKKNSRFGNYVFSYNFIQALNFYEKRHSYYVYSFCKKPRWFKESNTIRYKELSPHFLWSSVTVSLEENLEKKDIFLSLNQAIPLFTRSKVISFSHGLSYYFFPHYYHNSYAKLKRQLRQMMSKSDYIIVSSERVKSELLKLFPGCKKIIVIPFGVPFDMQEYREMERQNYFLFVGMNHPVKNIEFLIKAFLDFKRKTKFNNYKLYLIGDLDRYHSAEKGIFSFSSVSRSKLREFYSLARGYLCASYYESFNFPVLEALSQGCPVVSLRSAIIPELRTYVYLANNIKEFVSKMENIVLNRGKKIRTAQISKTFSWKGYISRISSLFDKLIE